MRHLSVNQRKRIRRLGIDISLPTSIGVIINAYRAELKELEEDDSIVEDKVIEKESYKKIKGIRSSWDNLPNKTRKFLGKEIAERVKRND